MSLKSRIFTVLTVAGATVAFSTVGFAQTTTTTTVPADKAAIEKGERGWHKGEGKRAGKRGEFGMRHAGGKGMRGHGRGMRMMFHDLNLTDAQKAQIKSIREANKPSGEYREELKAIHEAKKAGTLTDAQKARVQAIRAERQAKMKAVHEQVLNVLTAEQKAQIETRKAEMKARKLERKANRQRQAPATATQPSN